MHAYRVGEVKHLKGALRQRDEQIVELQDRLRELELAGTGDRLAWEAVEQAQGGRRARLGLPLGPRLMAGQQPGCDPWRPPPCKRLHALVPKQALY